MATSMEANHVRESTWNSALSRHAAPVLLLSVACFLAVDAGGRVPQFPGATTHIEIMGCRVDGLTAALRAYQGTGVPLISSRAEGQYEPAGFSDDVGSYLYIPLLADAFHVGVLIAVEYFYTALIWVSLLIGAAGWTAYCRTWLTRAVTIAILSAWGVRLAGQSDVYVITPAVTVAAIPWILWFSRRGKADVRLFGFIAGLAALAGAANFARSHGGTPVLIFAAIVLLFDRTFSIEAKAGMALAGFLGFAAPMALDGVAGAQRNEFLVRGGFRTADQLEAYTGRHPLWHSVYIGLGYVQNPLGITYDDLVAIAKVREIGGERVAYLSDEYERILRDECLRIAQTHPGFVLACYLSKLKVILADLLKFAHFGLLAALVLPLSRRVGWAFWLTMGFCALPAILAVPNSQYLLGFWAVATLFAAASLEQVLSRRFDQFGARSRQFGTVTASTITAVLISVVLFNSVSVGWSMRSRVCHAWDAERPAAATADAVAGSPAATAGR